MLNVTAANGTFNAQGGRGGGGRGGGRGGHQQGGRGGDAQPERKREAILDLSKCVLVNMLVLALA